MEQLRPQQGLEAADGGAAAEARDGVDERDGYDLVLSLFLGVWERKEEVEEKEEREREKNCRPRFFLAAITIEKLVSFLFLFIFLTVSRFSAQSPRPGAS